MQRRHIVLINEAFKTTEPRTDDADRWLQWHIDVVAVGRHIAASDPSFNQNIFQDNCKARRRREPGCQYD